MISATLDLSLWKLLAVIVVFYNVATYVSYRIRLWKLKAAETVYLDDGLFGFRRTKDILRRQKAGEIPPLFYEMFNEAKRDTLTFRTTGTIRYCTRDPENIKAILATQFNDFSVGQRLTQLGIFLGEGIFTLDGNGWKHSRAMLRPQFAREQVSHVKMLEPHVKQVIRRVKGANGSKFDIQPLFFKLTVDSGTEFLFGESCKSLRDDEVDISTLGGPKEAGQFSRAFTTAQSYLVKRVNFQKLYFLVNNQEFRDCNKTVSRFCEFYINRALQYETEELEKLSNGKYVFLFELVKQTRNPRVLRDQCLNILVAARDTTAGLMSFLFFELARNPRIFQKLRAEIVEAFGEGESADLSKMTFESLKRLEYLKWVLNETLRLYPSVPQNSRTAVRDTTLPRGGGPDGNEPVFMPKGDVVLYSIFSTQRNEALYGKDVLEFRPERWAEPELKKIGWGFLPFNGGPRICLGQQFALTEASYVTARLLQEFSNIESFDPPGDPKTSAQLTMALHRGANIGLY